MATGTPRIAVVVVTYNSADVLDGCLRSIVAGAEGVDLTHVVVADNASRDESLRIAKESTYLPIHTVQIGRNAGYAAAVNAGIDSMVLADLDAVFVINPDCRLRQGTLGRLAGTLAADPRRGIAAPRLVNPDGSLQPSLRREPTIRRALAEALLGKAAARIGTLGELLTEPSDYAHPRRVSWATGAAMFVASKVISDIGPWDERFLLYSEETEFALRAADHGYSLWYEPSAVVEHIGGESSINPQLFALLTVNKVVLYRMRHGRFASGVFYLVVLLGEVLRALAGRAVSRAATVALLRPSTRMRALPGG